MYIKSMIMTSEEARTIEKRLPDGGSMRNSIKEKSACRVGAKYI